jgi:hypothetical protein
MTYRFNKELLVINETCIFVRKYVQKVEINGVEMIVSGAGYVNFFSLPIAEDDGAKYKADLKQDIEAWLNGEYESNH